MSVRTMCVELRDQRGDTFITFRDSQEAREYIYKELPTIPKAREQLQALGIESLKVVLQIEPNVGACVAEILLDPSLRVREYMPRVNFA